MKKHMIQQLFNISDTMEDNGKTIKENNLNIQHDIPIGTLVEVKFDKWYGNGACMKVHARLFIVEHTRDCDGTPLYTLSHWTSPLWKKEKNAYYGFSKTRLRSVQITPLLKEGHGALQWEDEEMEATNYEPIQGENT
jgi:hypothetical protein